MRFLVLSILTGVLGTEDICRYNAHKKCRVYSILPVPFPSNEEELQNDCSNLVSIKECITEYMRKCGEEELPNEEYRPQYMDKDDLEREANRIRQNLKDDQRIIDVTTEICQEDSLLHASFVPDMACYREIFDQNNRDQICKDYTTNALDYLQSRIDRMRPERDEEFGKFHYCLRTLLDMNCFVEQCNRKCSSLAKDTVLEIMEKGVSLYDQCPVTFRLDILELLEDLKFVTRKDIYARQLLETDSFF